MSLPVRKDRNFNASSRSGSLRHNRRPASGAEPSSSHTVNLLRRLYDHADDLLRFLVDPRTPFDNPSSRARYLHAELKQKVSGAFRTREGAASFRPIRPYLATLRKQSPHLFESLVLTFKGEPPEPILSG